MLERIHKDSIKDMILMMGLLLKQISRVMLLNMINSGIEQRRINGVILQDMTNKGIRQYLDLMIKFIGMIRIIIVWLCQKMVRLSYIINKGIKYVLMKRVKNIYMILMVIR